MTALPPFPAALPAAAPTGGAALPPAADPEALPPIPDPSCRRLRSSAGRRARLATRAPAPIGCASSRGIYRRVGDVVVRRAAHDEPSCPLRHAPSPECFAWPHSSSTLRRLATLPRVLALRILSIFRVIRANASIRENIIRGRVDERRGEWFNRRIDGAHRSSMNQASPRKGSVMNYQLGLQFAIVGSACMSLMTIWCGGDSGGTPAGAPGSGGSSAVTTTTGSGGSDAPGPGGGAMAAGGSAGLAASPWSTARKRAASWSIRSPISEMGSADIDSAPGRKGSFFTYNDLSPMGVETPPMDSTVAPSEIRASGARASLRCTYRPRALPLGEPDSEATSLTASMPQQPTRARTRVGATMPAPMRHHLLGSIRARLQAGPAHERGGQDHRARRRKVLGRHDRHGTQPLLRRLRRNHGSRRVGLLQVSICRHEAAEAWAQSGSYRQSASVRDAVPAPQMFNIQLTAFVWSTSAGGFTNWPPEVPPAREAGTRAHPADGASNRARRVAGRADRTVTLLDLCRRAVLMMPGSLLHLHAATVFRTSLFCWLGIKEATSWITGRCSS